MFVIKSADVALFRMNFSETHDFVQKFRGVSDHSIYFNIPVDFMEAGLVDNSKRDCFHLDVPFGISTDEVPPVYVNGGLIGGNHAQVVSVDVLSNNHNITYKDISSKWIDEAGNIFYLYRITSDNVLNYVSHNIGVSEVDYKFITKITGNLHNEDGRIIEVESQNVGYFGRSNKYINKTIYTIKDGVRSELFGSTNCEYAEIVEEYDIINPATVVEGLIDNCPIDGYSSNPDLSKFGKPMIKIKNIYRVLPDTTILTFFEIEALQNVSIDRCLGAMFQEKLDVYGGGIYRYIPKTLPFQCEDGNFDFSTPVSLYGGAFPLNYEVRKDDWENKNSPPDRIVDLFKNKNGKFNLAYACGFLPVFDGAPEIRKNTTDIVVYIYSSRKAYPYFSEGKQKRIKGVAYKKFFKVDDNKKISYTINFNNQNYLYTDIFENSDIKMQFNGKISVLEASTSLDVSINEREVFVSGNKGYVVLKEEN